MDFADPMNQRKIPVPQEMDDDMEFTPLRERPKGRKKENVAGERYDSNALPREKSTQGQTPKKEAKKSKET